MWVSALRECVCVVFGNTKICHRLGVLLAAILVAKLNNKIRIAYMIAQSNLTINKNKSLQRKVPQQKKFGNTSTQCCQSVRTKSSQIKTSNDNIAGNGRS